MEQDMVKDNGAVMFFYPKADTGGCTRQACGFRDNLATIEGAGFKPEAQAAWKVKQSYPYSLLCDPSFEVLAALGVTKENNTKINRSHIIVEKGGQVIDVKIPIGPDDSVPEALKFIASLA
eukprot:gene14990-21048_t